jgi:hypothetical protein
MEEEMHGSVSGLAHVLAVTAKVDDADTGSAANKKMEVGVGVDTFMLAVGEDVGKGTAHC